MNRIIQNLIDNYYKLQPFMETQQLIPKGHGNTGFIVLRSTSRAAEIWNYLNPGTKQPDDDLANEALRAAMIKIANQLFFITKGIILSENKSDEIVFGKEKFLGISSDKDMDHEEKINWCIVRLYKLGVIDYQITEIHQPIVDNDGVLFGNKRVAEEEKDDEELEEIGVN